jgi:hypothetical protein
MHGCRNIAFVLLYDYVITQSIESSRIFISHLPIDWERKYEKIHRRITALYSIAGDICRSSILILVTSKKIRV